MDKETISKVFEPFYTTKFQGRGLGLAAVYGIVKNHDGEILIDSEIGKGTKVQILFPYSEVKEEISQIGKTELKCGDETILVIDDEESVLKVSKKMLERYGYKVITASDGKEAVDIARMFKDDIHVAILDMGMPIMGGTDAFYLIREARPNIKIIISSGYELDAYSKSLLDEGADAFIQKPFIMDTFLQEIRNILDR
jgi:CheY-like chemotaxis protein